MTRKTTKTPTVAKTTAHDVKLGDVYDLDIEPGPYLMAGPDGSVGTTGPGTYRFNLAGEWRLMSGDGKRHVATYNVSEPALEADAEDDLEDEDNLEADQAPPVDDQGGA